MQIQDTERYETNQESNSDPFACLSSQIYVSPFLDLIRTPAGSCGDWLCLDDHDGTPVWYCRLTACRFVWLRSSVNEAIRSNRLSESFRDALMALEWIADIGIRNGFFTADQIADHVHAPESFHWWDGCPHWALDY